MLKTLLNKLAMMFAAAAFAEEGEAETARQIMKEEKRVQRIQTRNNNRLELRQ